MDFKNIEILFNNITLNQNEEIEIEFKLKNIVNYLFFNDNDIINNLISYVDYINILEYLKYIANNKNILFNDKLIKNDNINIFNVNTLDINKNIKIHRQNIDDKNIGKNDINDKTLQKSIENKRITIYSENYIDEILKNNITLENILFTLKKNDYNFNIINKLKEKNIYNEDFGFNVSRSKEKKNTISDFENFDKEKNIYYKFRLKERTSLILYDDNFYTLRYDLTRVKQSNINIDLNKKKNMYEFEIELLIKEKNNDFIKIKNIFFTCILNFFYFLQQSNYLVSKSNIINDLKFLQNIIFENKDNNILTSLPSINVKSLNKEIFYEKLPNNFAVSDKADGERCFFIHSNKNSYLIFNNLKIRKIDIRMDNVNILILDGELIYINNIDDAKINKFLFLAFEVIYFANQKNNLELSNITKQSNVIHLTDRYNNLQDIIINNFNFPYKFKKITKFIEENEANKLNDKKDNIQILDNNIYDEIKKNILEYFNILNNIIINSQNNIIITYKIFLFPFGLNKNEIYQLSQIFYEKYFIDNIVKYKLDGLIYTPLYSSYDKNINIYKWKPPNLNSIDFYVNFKKDKDNQIIYVYDNKNLKNNDEILNISPEKNEHINKTNLKIIEDEKNYIICELYVYDVIDKKNKPILFNPGFKENLSYVYLNVDEFGITKDIEGIPIIDNTIVEFSYDKMQIDANRKWIPLRTRYDKTDIMQKYNIKYGNQKNVANLIWQTIIEPITFDNLYSIENNKEIYFINKKNKNIENINSDNNINAKYYKFNSNLAEPLRKFHNWIKNNLIILYCKNKIILDMGIGKGGDINKYLNANVKKGIGIDINYSGLFLDNDSALNRYNELKKKYVNKKKTPSFIFLQMDAKKKLHFKYQENFLKNISKQDIKKSLIFFDEKNKNKQFDVLTFFFSIHYLFESNLTIKNLCYNINTFLKKNGFLIITTFDGKKIYDLLYDKNIIECSYTNDFGEKINLFTIKKKYDNNDIDKKPLQIDVNIKIFMDSDDFYSEYLIFPDKLEKLFDSYCNLKLIEKCNFNEIIHSYKNYFNNLNENLIYDNKFKKYIQDIKYFINSDDNLSKCSRFFSELNNYYVFKKI